MSLIKVPKPISNDAYKLHQEVWKLFSHEKKRNFLFRQYKDTSTSLVIIQSLSKPIESDDFDGVLMITKEFHPSFKKGMKLWVKFNINPVIRKSGSDKVYLKSVKQITKYAQERLKGANILDVNIEKLEPLLGYKNNNRIILNNYLIEGSIVITDPVEFDELLRKGIGRGKSMGLGLISVQQL